MPDQFPSFPISFAPSFPVSFGITGGGWSPLQLPGLVAFYDSRDGSTLLNGSDEEASDGDNIKTWQDKGPNGYHLSQTSAALRPLLDIDGGPDGGACITSLLDSLTHASFGTTYDDPTIIVVGKIRSDSSVGSMLWSGTSGKQLHWQRTSTDRGFGYGQTGNTGATIFNQDEWGQFTLGMVEGAQAGRWSWADMQYQPTIGTLGVCQLDGFTLGARYDNVLQIRADFLEVIILETTPDLATMRQLRNYLVGKYGFEWASENNLEDTFTRANTPDNDIGVGETGQAWEGSSTSARILDNTLTIVSPWATNYSWAQINFPPASFEWDWSARDEGGSVQEVGAVLITKDRQDLDNMLHLVWSFDGWRLEQYVSDGGVTTYVVAERTYAAPELTGTLRAVVDWSGGTVTITDAEGVTTVGDWNAEANEPLANFKTPYLCYEVGIQSAGTPADVIQYAAVRASRT